MQNEVMRYVRDYFFIFHVKTEHFEKPFVELKAIETKDMRKLVSSVHISIHYTRHFVLGEDTCIMLSPESFRIN
jgi:hypothetical protein